MTQYLNLLNIIFGFLIAVASVWLRLATKPSERWKHLVEILIAVVAGLTCTSGILKWKGDQRQQKVDEELREKDRRSQEELRNKAEENLNLSRDLKARTEENIRLSDRITQLAETAINTVTGGDSFCYIDMEVRNSGLYPVVLSKGPYPLYDLSVRLWDPKEWEKMPLSRNSPLDKVAAETSRLGTLPSQDFISLGRMPLPSGIEQQYTAEFSARNGSWSQSIVLRRFGNSWKVATIVQKSARVVKFKELNKKRPILCYIADPDFPETETGELRRWTGHAQSCQEH